jgi:hypothetical protein
MKTQIKFTLLSTALSILALPVVAQNTNAPATGQSNGPAVQQRAENQQDRIANGVKSGELTAGETSNLETKEGKINQETRDMRKQDDGHLTATDQAKINQQQNQLSQQIYQDKHNPATQNTNPTSEVGKRMENQQDRIAKGVKSGDLSAGQAAHLEKNDAKIKKGARDDRASNGGTLTPQERAQVNNQLNRQSHQITRATRGGGRR